MEPQITYNSIDAFDKDLKRLAKKFPSLLEDLGLVKRAAIELFHLKKIDNHAVFPIPDFCSDTYQVFKIKKFACRSLKGRGVKSGIRVIYFFHIQKLEVIFIEMYFKSEQENENRLKIKEYLKTIDSSI
ncbi:MAG: hypothetical protein A3A96_01340 [Candidatus Zambryskibacteria bacterium RIFCSPLOWO2_01_FULL_39_39]|uniref:Addiction module toxin RelE n=2 Tax=Patescibacteria group TaxID=1783273 RepID=A0A1G2U040_9BACT|nr:MAG: hypothetical protein UT61_C0019G0028 [Candidatus Woesebacteria bacterium GW2011_GWA1_39_8]OHA86692.1 MAG: hypothetical protein A2644_03280 [Candidatus Zambryskibacteria bacterium RIFCSPHIGHO2_01_FULL_39_63]OHA95265.1 MAG: hypothetical protein A3B88_03045 [Candidatus Zambryskibacteria bacterium RIFCSPHIGHO2_02_FULL_39_19]OHA98860.1 MAG: hypothetical protein A3F20_02320 [Candidatus Zambryskibacteria bacterium RIFCSPHIGHO2_12_FULL_39_21]OHB02769.1 MAG: hypothetical protein A3A96_01340 [Can